MEVGARIRKERHRRHLSQEALAEALGTSVRSISRWERGQALPQAYYRLQICQLFDLSPEELFEEKQEPCHAPRYWYIPYSRNPFFVGRGAILTTLHQGFAKSMAEGKMRIQALCGLGGMGKTQTALEYAYRFAHAYQAVLWLPAETQETLLTGILHIAHILHIDYTNERDDRKVFEKVKHWLNEHMHWLLILDNVQDFAVISDLISQQGKGQILVTTRQQSLNPVVWHINLDKLRDEEGLYLLLRRSKLLAVDASIETASDTLIHHAQSIIELMDGLPLALDQVGAYIDETGCHFLDYLHRYNAHSKALLDRRGQEEGGHPQSVLTTFSLTFAQIEQAQSAANDLLYICALLYPDAIPEEIFMQDQLFSSEEQVSLTFEPLQFDEALALLRRYSLLKRDTETHMLTIHPLTQAALKAHMDQETYRYWVKQTIQVINRAFPPVEEFTTWSRCQRLLSQALLCATLIEQENMCTIEAARLLHQIGIYLLEYAQYERAHNYLKRAYHIRLQLFGANHPRVAESLNYLAEFAYYTGRYGEAETLYQQALIIRQQHLGPTHLDVALSLNNLAGLYCVQGRYEQAEQLYKQTLAIREQGLDSEHLDIAETLQNIATLYYLQGKYAQAEPLYQRAKEICEHILGKHHAYLTTIYNNIGQLAHAQGHYTQAEAMYQQARQLCEEQLDREHPHYAAILHNLAGLYCVTGRSAQARHLYEQALQIRRHRLGPEHPRVAQTLYELARLHWKQGNSAQTIALYQQAWHIRVNVLGINHPDVTTMQEEAKQWFSQNG